MKKTSKIKKMVCALFSITEATTNHSVPTLNAAVSEVDQFFIPWRQLGGTQGVANQATTPVTYVTNVGTDINATGAITSADLRIVVKPIDVVNELKVAPTQFSLVGLDEKIEILKIKRELVTQSYTQRDLESLIAMLENRKQWNKVHAFFSGFDVTTDEKINAVLTKYKLVRNSADIFVPELPDIAAKTMKRYAQTVKELCGKKIGFEVIATEESFKKTYERRDPILFAQSPFGLYYYILGVWDREMLLLGEL
jgi:hypothetical protein